MSYSLTPVSAINPNNASFINFSSLLVTYRHSSVPITELQTNVTVSAILINQRSHLQHLGVDSRLLEIYYNIVESEQQFLFPDHMHRQDCQTQKYQF